MAKVCPLLNYGGLTQIDGWNRSKLGLDRPELIVLDPVK